MRTVSFSNDQIQNAFNNDFVSCYTNTEGDPSAGGSIRHNPEDSAGPCGPTAGRQNVQTFFLTPDNKIFHVAGGFRSAKDLLDDIKFAKQIYAKIKASPDQADQIVADFHTDRLKKLGFSKSDLAKNDRLGNQMLGMPTPSDMGFDLGKLTGQSGRRNGNKAFDMFAQMTKQRVFEDSKYLIQNPLIDRQSFENNPQKLTGNGKTFFASQGNNLNFNSNK